MKPLPSPAYLHKRLRYVPSTGKLYWKHYPPHGVSWNARCAGKEVCCTFNSNGYPCLKIDRVKRPMHRIIWAMVTGRWTVKPLDHQDHDKSNNRIRNLRVTTHLGNVRNQKLNVANTSGVSGVVWHARDQRWFARIGNGKEVIHLGSYVRFEDAVARRRRAEVKYGYHENHGSS